jgi:hypothetical protein
MTVYSFIVVSCNIGGFRNVDFYGFCFFKIFQKLCIGLDLE